MHECRPCPNARWPLVSLFKSNTSGLLNLDGSLFPDSKQTATLSPGFKLIPWSVVSFKTVLLKRPVLALNLNDSLTALGIRLLSLNTASTNPSLYKSKIKNCNPPVSELAPDSVGPVNNDVMFRSLGLLLINS